MYCFLRSVSPNVPNVGSIFSINVTGFTMLAYVDIHTAPYTHLVGLISNQIIGGAGTYGLYIYGNDNGAFG